MHALQGHFPEAEKDPVIQIASMVTEQGKQKPTVRNVMTLKSCAAIVGAEVMSFEHEAELLKVRLMAAAMQAQRPHPQGSRPKPVSPDCWCTGMLSSTGGP